MKTSHLHACDQPGWDTAESDVPDSDFYRSAPHPSHLVFYTHNLRSGVEARFEVIVQISFPHGSWNHTSRGQIIKSINAGGALAVVWDSGRSGCGFPTTPETREDTCKAEVIILKMFREWLAKGTR